MYKSHKSCPESKEKIKMRENKIKINDLFKLLFEVKY